MKANNQMEWVQKMNSIKNSVEEIIFQEIHLYLKYIFSIKATNNR